MSDFGAILDASLIAVTTAIPVVTTSRDVQVIDRIAADQFPFAIAWGTSAPASEEEHVQETRRISISILLITKGETQEAMYTKADAIRTELYADRTLGGLVDSLLITDMVPAETPGTGQKSMTMSVETRRVE